MKKLQVEIESLLIGHDNSLYALAESDEFIFTGGSGHLIAAWPKKNIEDKFALAKIEHPVYQFKTFKDRLYIGQTNGALMIIDCQSKQIEHNIKLHEKPIFDILIEKNFLLTLGGDGVLKILDTNLQLYQSITVSNKSLRQGVITDNFLWIASSDGCLIKINLDDFSIQEKYPLHQKSVFAIAITENFIVSAGRDACMIIQDKNSEEVIHKIPAHQSTINALAINKEKSLLASASKDKTIKIWDTQTWQLLKVINYEKYGYHSNSVNKIIWLDDHKSLISISDDRLGVIWKIQSI